MSHASGYGIAYWLGALVVFIVLTARRAYYGYGSAVSFEVGVYHAVLSCIWPAMLPYWVGIGIGKLLRKLRKK